MEIKGYRKLTEEEINTVNQLKNLEHDVLSYFETVDGYLNLEKRWMAIAKTHIEQGFMAAVRAVTKPE